LSDLAKFSMTRSVAQSLRQLSLLPAGRFTPNFACGRTLVPNVSSPLLAVGGPRRAEKGANEIFVTMGVNGEFLHFGGF